MLVFLDKCLLVLLVKSDELFLVTVLHLVYVYLGKSLASFQNQNTFLTLWGCTQSDVVFGNVNYLNMVSCWVKISSTLMFVVLHASFVIFDIGTLLLQLIFRK